MGLHRKDQIDALKTEFQNTTIVKESATECVLTVNHVVLHSSGTRYALSLIVKLPLAFPNCAPVVTLPYSYQPVRITPPNVSPSEVAAYEWDPSASTLVHAVRNAFQHAADLWGPVTPPTMETVSALLHKETNGLLVDLAENSNCLDAYCYQLPLVKQMRDASRQTISEVEQLANNNLLLRSTVEQLQKDVQGLQDSLRKNVDEMQKAKSNNLLASVGTPELLRNTLCKDAEVAAKHNTKVANDILALDYAKDRKKFEEMLEDFKNEAQRRWMLEMKHTYAKTLALLSMGMNSGGSSSDSENGTVDAQVCLKCKAVPATYCTNTCKHVCFCDKCAMKCATGGKCKKCNTFYGSLERI